MPPQVHELARSDFLLANVMDTVGDKRGQPGGHLIGVGKFFRLNFICTAQ